MPTVTFELPEGVFSALRRSPDEFAREMRLAAAIHWYSRGLIPHEKAAGIAGLSRVAFIDALAREQVDAFHVDIDELKGELGRGRLAHREHLAAGLPGQSGVAGDASGP